MRFLGLHEPASIDMPYEVHILTRPAGGCFPQPRTPVAQGILNERFTLPEYKKITGWTILLVPSAPEIAAALDTLIAIEGNAFLGDVRDAAITHLPRFLGLVYERGPTEALQIMPRLYGKEAGSCLWRVLQYLKPMPRKGLRMLILSIDRLGCEHFGRTPNLPSITI